MYNNILLYKSIKLKMLHKTVNCSRVRLNTYEYAYIKKKYYYDIQYTNTLLTYQILSHVPDPVDTLDTFIKTKSNNSKMFLPSKY